MAACLPSLCAAIKPPLKRSFPRVVQVRAQSFNDEGRSSNIVDGNLSVLREKIELLKKKERLESCCKREYGWNYVPGYNYKLKRHKETSQFFELVGLVCGTLGFTCLSGVGCLCLVSFFFHLIQ